jgi:hypothetical protein
MVGSNGCEVIMLEINGYDVNKELMVYTEYRQNGSRY